MAVRLSEFLNSFDAVCQLKLGHTYEFAALKQHFQDHATGKRHLTAKDAEFGAMNRC
jgi:hypothetical protein